MKLLTIFELAAKPDSELHALYRVAFNEAANGERTGQDHQNALATLANIRRVLNSRALRP
ncbi:TPA: hypothetical protein NID94_003991 [Pseudomonas aeruginosa]|nr:hypothetical protein [Pseudomonas aeruginosa]